MTDVLSVPREAWDDARAVRLSGAQRRLWFLHQLAPESLEYVEAFAFRFRGGIDPHALERALLVAVARHEALRTRFDLVDGEPVQLIEDPPAELLRYVDLRGVDRAEREPRARELVDAELHRPFDLTRSPLLRAILVRLGEEESVLGMALHHITFDAWSIGVLGDDLEVLYDAFAAGAEPVLPPVSRQYADFAVREPRGAERESLERGLDYWRRKLEGAPHLELPNARTRPPRRSGAGSEHGFELPQELADAVLDVSRERRVTPYMTLLAAFATLLHRYSAQTDFCVGSPVANRNRVEFERTIGFFLNMVVLRLDTAGDPTFAELLDRVRQTSLEAFRHHEVPFDQVVEAVNPPRDLSRTPLFQAQFSLLDFSRPLFRLRGIQIEDWPLERPSSQVDLLLEVTQRRRTFSGRIVYATDLFDRGTIERLAGHYVELLRDALRDPGRRLSELGLLTGRERVTMLEEWNDTAAPYPGVATHELVAETARRRPDAIAVESDRGRLTYSELEARANRLAHELVALGVERETRVGVCLDRSPGLLVALLAVWKAGGAYVPLDPHYPRDRNLFMLDDAGARVLVRDGSAELPFSPEATIDLARLEWRGPDAPPPVASPPEQLAYVIYTSGSTGKPKGVEIEHGSLVNLLVAVARELELGEDDVVLASTTLSFDVAAAELYAPLLVGGRVAIAPAQCAGDAAAYADAVARFGCTAMQATPTTWRLLVESGWEGAPGATAFSVGEVLPSELAHRIVGLGLEMWNFYGPTETTIYSTVDRVRLGQPLTIGRPLANQSVYVLDAALQPLPIGVPGELYIGGDGVARGYHGRPELTAERFVGDPFGGGRLYRTGDVARWLPDGRLEFLGRSDNQVKIRGVRIELAEVEQRLAAHESVEAALALAHADGAEGKRLVAYVRPRGPSPETSDLRRWVRAQLPDAMVPSEFVFVDEFPRTPNGKLDRKALPAPSRPAAGGEAAPTTEVETEIGAIWREVLALDEIGLDHDFFDVGGHSLAALKVVAEVGARFGVELPADAIFDAPTLEEFASLVAASL
jgi:amino acid adenylation domain-containing protein